MPTDQEIADLSTMRRRTRLLWFDAGESDAVEARAEAQAGDGARSWLAKLFDW